MLSRMRGTVKLPVVTGIVEGDVGNGRIAHFGDGVAVGVADLELHRDSAASLTLVDARAVVVGLARTSNFPLLASDTDALQKLWCKKRKGSTGQTR